MNHKITIGVCLAVFILYSCSKPSSNSPVPNGPTPTITYYFNDSLVTIAGNGLPDYKRSLAWIACFHGSAMYSLTGQDASLNSSSAVHNNILLNFIHDTTIQNTIYYLGDSLKVHTYYFNTQVNSPMSYPPIDFVRVGPNGLARQFEILNGTDSFSLTINRYSNGTIDGTFSGILSGMGGVSSVAAGQTAEITNGQFSNIPVVF